MPTTRRTPWPVLFAACLALGAASAQTPTPLTAEQVGGFVQFAQQRFGTVGIAVAVVQDGKVLCEVAAGERADGDPVTPTTLFNIASCSKAFTAACVARLVEQGRLRWDDRVVQHVPEFRMADPWITAHMTVRDLLCHRSGLVTFAGDLLWYGSEYDDAEILRRLERLPITQNFREHYGYQNLMYMVAGLVVQRVSGKTWEDLVEAEFLAPLGMADSRAAAGRIPAGVAIATPHIGGEPIAATEFLACKPAGAMYSSVHDLSAWLRMLLAGGAWDGKTVLTDASLREMWRPHVALGQGSGGDTRDFRSYGLGWFLSLERGRKVVEHDGGMPGFLSKVSLVPSESFGFAVLNNGNDGLVNEAVKRALFAARAGGDGKAALERLLEVKERMAERERREAEQRAARRVVGTHPSKDLAAYAGSYTDAVYGPARVELRDGALHVELVPSRKKLFGTLTHWHHDTFRVDFPDPFLPFALVRFELDHTAAVVGFRIDCPIVDFDFGALDFRRDAAAIR